MPLNSKKKSSRKAKILPQIYIPSGNRPLLDLLEIQRKSFFDLLENGIPHELAKTSIFRETTKNSLFTQELELILNPETYTFISPNSTPKHAILKGKTYACKLYVQATLIIKSQNSQTVSAKKSTGIRRKLSQLRKPCTSCASYLRYGRSTASPVLRTELAKQGYAQIYTEGGRRVNSRMSSKHPVDQQYAEMSKACFLHTPASSYRAVLTPSGYTKYSTLRYGKAVLPADPLPPASQAVLRVPRRGKYRGRSTEHPEEAVLLPTETQEVQLPPDALYSVRGKYKASTLEHSSSRREYVTKLIPNVYAKWMKKGLNKFPDLDMDPHSVTKKLQVPSISKKSSHFNKSDTVTKLETLINSRLTKFTRGLERNKTEIEFFYQVIRNVEKPKNYDLLELQVSYPFDVYQVQSPTDALWRCNSSLFRKAAAFGVRNSLKLRKKEKLASIEVTPQTLFNLFSKHFIIHLSLFNTRCFLRYISNLGKLPQLPNLNKPPVPKITTTAIKLFHSLLVYPSTSSTKMNVSTPCLNEGKKGGNDNTGINNGISYSLAASIFPRKYVIGEVRSNQKQEWNILSFAYPSLPTKMNPFCAYPYPSASIPERTVLRIPRRGKYSTVGNCAHQVQHLRTKYSKPCTSYGIKLPTDARNVPASLFLDAPSFTSQVQGYTKYNTNRTMLCPLRFLRISPASQAKYRGTARTWVKVQGKHPQLPTNACISSMPQVGNGTQAILYKRLKPQLNILKESINRVAGPRFLKNKHAHFDVIWFATPISLGSPQNKKYLGDFDGRHQILSTSWIAPHYQSIGRGLAESLLLPTEALLPASQALYFYPCTSYGVRGQHSFHTVGRIPFGPVRTVLRIPRRGKYSIRSFLQMPYVYSYPSNPLLSTKMDPSVERYSYPCFAGPVGKTGHPTVSYLRYGSSTGMEAVRLPYRRQETQEVQLPPDALNVRSTVRGKYSTCVRSTASRMGKEVQSFSIPERTKYSTVRNGVKASSLKWTSVRSEAKPFVGSVQKVEKYTKGYLSQKKKISVSKFAHFSELDTSLVENKKLQIFRPWIYLGELPLMTKRGHFILNGSPRVIVNQIARCPGIYFQEKRRGVGFEQEVRVSADLIPQRGPWLRIQSDWEGRFWARLKQEGRVKYATLYEAFQEFEKQYHAPLVNLIANRSSTFPKSEIIAFQERKTKEDRQKKALTRLFKNSTRYSLGKLGRIRINQRIHFRPLYEFNRLEQNISLSNLSILLLSSLQKLVTTNKVNFFLKTNKLAKRSSNNAIHHYINAFVNPYHSDALLNSKTTPYALLKLQKAKQLALLPADPLPRTKYRACEAGSTGLVKQEVQQAQGGKYRGIQAVESKEEINSLLMAKDIDAIHVCLERLLEGQGFTDDIDHLKNRFIRTSGKLLQQQFELGLHRLTEVITPLLKNLLQSHFALLKDSGALPLRRKSKVILRTEGSKLPTTMLNLRSSETKPPSVCTSHILTASHRTCAFQLRKPCTSCLRYGSSTGMEAVLLPYRRQETVGCPLLLPTEGRGETKRGNLNRTSKPSTSAGKQRHQSRNTRPVTPFRWLRTSKPINGAFREFFGSNPLSQYMDQTNPLAEITHKRRLSSMGPGGIKRETAGMEVRGIHPTHYGRVCPIETPEGKNAGLVNSPTVYGRIGKYGFLETPLYQVRESQVQLKRWAFFSAQQEEDEISSLATCDTGLLKFNFLGHVPIPVQTANNPLAHFQQVERNRVGYRALSPVQTISIATALIPFLEHDDANRALMGSNMQRQAIPLLLPERPIVGTGFEPLVVVESGQSLQATQLGCVSYINANSIVIHSIPSIASIGNEVKALPFPTEKAKNFLRNDFDNEFSSVLLSKVSSPYAFEVQLLRRIHFSGRSNWRSKELNLPALLPSITHQVIPVSVSQTQCLPLTPSFTSPEAFVGECASSIPLPRFLPCCTSYAQVWKKPRASYLRYGNEAGSIAFPTEEAEGKYRGSTKYSTCVRSTASRRGKEVQVILPTVWKRSRDEVKSIGSKPKLTGTRLHLCSSHNTLFLTPIRQTLQPYQRSNQETCLHQRPLVQEGDWVQRGDFLADCSASHMGDLSLGKNVTVAYMPWEGYNFEDAIVISDRLVSDDIYTSLHIERYEIKVNKNSQGKERITNRIPGISRSLKHLNNSGIAHISSWVQPGDILVGKVIELKRPLSPYERLAWELASRLSPASPEREKWLNKVWLEDISLRLPPGICGRVINSQIISTEWSDKEQLAHPLEVHIYLAVKRKIQIGDKLAGRHGNKGIVSTILPQQDMPYLGDGRSIDMVLNPLGVPSRMNLGQIFECLLGLAGSQLGCNFKITPFDEVAGGEASRSLVFLKLYQCRLVYKQQWLFTPTFPGKSKLFDGRTGEPFENWVTVGQAYMLKLIHMVDHKIHARSTGPYSLFTRQPVRGRSRRGGQRLGEMEVWAVEGFGAAYTLQEFLTIKSDDLKARTALQRSFYKQNDITFGTIHISPGNPEAFKVLISELQALCLHIQM